MPPQGGESAPDPDGVRASTDIEDTSDDEDEYPHETRGRTRSLDSVRKRIRNRELTYLPVNTQTLTTEQEDTINAATELLTKEQKERVKRRQDRVTSCDVNDDEPGTSLHKGKTTDPREWGNSGLAPEEMDIAVQKAILDAYDRGRNAKRSVKTPRQKIDEPPDESENEEIFQLPLVAKHRSAMPNSSAQNLETRRTGSRPAAQIVPNSSLGIALGNAAQMSRGQESSEASDDESEYTTRSSGYSRSVRSCSSSRSRRRRRSSRKRSKKGARRHRKRSHSSTTIKPIPPKSYDGTADSRAYHRFVMEGQVYLRDGKVPRECQIRILAYHLDGKAYNFYMQKVASDDPSNWNLHKFFTELFNYCFPVDYRQRMRLKLENFYQKHNQSVSEYVFELQELFSMVGAMPAEMKVIKLWYSLSTRIQRAMWRDGLHPDSSTWDEVVAKVEVIKIADNVVDRRDGPKPQNRKNWRPNTIDHGHQRTPDPASRSMTYANNNDRRSDHGNQGPSQGRSTSQARQNSIQHSRGRFRNEKSTSRTSNNKNSGLSSRKSVKFVNLTDKEMAQLRAEGKCFNCKEPGHMSRNCPHKNTVKGSGGNKPPGVPSYSMDMNVITDDNDSEDVIQTMPVGAIDMEPVVAQAANESNEGWRKWYPTWRHPQALAREQIGDCYAMTAEYLLTIHQPYPGDDLKNERTQDCSPHNRFKVKQTSRNTGKFRIIDRFKGFECIINKRLLQNPKFNLGHWYAKKRARALNLWRPSTKEYPAQLENPIVLVTSSLLKNGISSHFPNVKPDTWTELRFFVYLKDYGSTTYVIVDDDLDTITEIDLKLLENPEFDLIKWYLGHAKTNGMFYKRYTENHRLEYQACSANTSTDPCAFRDLEEPDELSAMRNIIKVLEDCTPFPGDDNERYPIDPALRKQNGGSRFELDLVDTLNQKLLCVYD